MRKLVPLFYPNRFLMPVLVLLASSVLPGPARPVLAGEPATEPPSGALEHALSRATPAEELARRRALGDSLLLRTAVFDPLREAVPEFVKGHSVTGREKTFLVQFFHDLTPLERQELEQSGLRFLDYIPSHTYLVRASPAAFAVLASHPLVRWLDAYRGGYKLATVLESDAWAQDLYLDFRLLPDENPMDLLKRLRGIDATVRLEAVHGEVARGAVLRVLLPAGHLHPFVETAAGDGAVWTVEPWYLPKIENNNSIWVLQSYDTTNRLNYAISATLWNHGITGTGQTPAIADTGLDDDMCYFRDSASPAEVTDSQSPALPGIGAIDPAKKVAAYFVLPHATAYDGNTPCGGIPESFHGTHVTGSVVGDNYLTLSSPNSGGHDYGDGMAPNARVIFQDAGSEVSGCLDGLASDFHLIWKQAYDAGARIHSNSWGSAVGGAYTDDSRQIDEIVYGYEDLLILFANGNSGPAAQTVGSPATAKDCLAVGATSNGSAGANSIASFSSRGPASDGRRKPDIVAPGTSIVSASGDASHTSNNCGTKSLSGTSMATPTAAGGATLLRQYFTDGFYPTGAKTGSDALGPSAALLRAALINGAVDISNTTQATMLQSLNPDGNQGFGRIELDNVAFFSTPSRDSRRTRVWDKWNATGLTTGQTDSYALQVAAGQPLKVVLAWTDPPASLLAATALVNNLDLEVVDPSNNLYRGNVVSGGQSVTGGAADLVNTVELVFLKTPAAGTWTLRVKATSVPGTPAEPSSARQGYALVATYADCTATLAAPTGLFADDGGASGIDLSWGAVGGATGYQIYRADGACDAPATSFHLLGRTSQTSFTDTLVQGGYGYAYAVRAVTACTEGPLTACMKATSTGACGLDPTFAGISSAVNDTTTAICDNLLGWDAGSSRCPLAPSVSYDVYRSTDPYFSPGPATILSPGASGTSYRDSAVTPNRTYYYVVRAEDGSTGNGGPANDGNVEQNRVVMTATATSSTTYPGTWTDGGGDGTARLVLESPWTVSNQQDHTDGGSLGYHSGPDGGTYPPNRCAAVTTPPIPLQAGQSPILSYWARYDLEYQWDGVVVEITTNGGGSWTVLNPTPPYPTTLALTGNPPVNACGYSSTQGAFTGPSANGALTPWTQYTHDLTAYAGQTVEIRWRFTTDPGVEYEGFYLDDIAVTNALAPSSCGADVRYVASAIQSDSCAGGGAGSGNGILEAGEDVTVSVSLQNIGEVSATGLTATLSTDEWKSVVVTRAAAAFADAGSGSTVVSAAPHFGIFVAPTVACGASLPFTLRIDSAQGSFTRNFNLTVGSGSPGCLQTVCTGALPVEDGTAPSPLRIGKGAGSGLNLVFGVGCHTVDSTVYQGRASGSMTGLGWTSAACGFGSAGTAAVDPGAPVPGELFYFVVVPENGLNEGSYGRDSSGQERPAASGLGGCNPAQQLGGICP